MLQAKFHLERVMQSADRNHSRYANQRREYTELDQQVAECKEEADWLAVFRLLLWKAQLQQVLCFSVCTIESQYLSSRFPHVKFWTPDIAAVATHAPGTTRAIASSNFNLY